MKISLADRQPIYRIVNDVVISKRANYTIGFGVKLREAFSLSPDDYDEIGKIMLSVIKRLPNYTVVHKQDWFNQVNYGINNREEDSLLSTYTAFKFLERKYVSHECYLYFTKTTADVKKRTSSVSLLNRKIVPSDLIDREKYDEFRSAVMAIQDMLNHSGYFIVKKLDKADYYDVVDGKGLIPSYFSLEKGGVSATDIDFRSGVKVGMKHAAIHTISNLRDFPDGVDIKAKSNKYDSIFSFAFPLGINLKFDHIYNQYIFIDNPDLTLKELEDRARTVSNYTLVSNQNSVTYNKLNEFVKGIADAGRIPVRVHANVITFSDTEAELANNAVSVETAMSEMGFRPRVNIANAGELYWAGCPGNSSDMANTQTATVYADQAICLMNLEGNYRHSVSDFGMKLTDRINNYPIHVDFVFEPKKLGLISNYNMFVVGPSGSGKSFFTNSYIRHLLDHGHHAVIVDMGRSYKRLCELYGGIFIDFDEDNPLQFNPFYLPEGMKINDDKVESLLTLIFSLWLDRESSKAEISILRELINGYYELLEAEPFFPSFNSFFEYVERYYNGIKNGGNPNLKYFDFDNFFVVLRQYYNGGIYDQLLNGEKDLDLTHNKFVVFELENIKNNQTLLTIEMLMIMDTYINKLLRLGEDSNVMKALVIEEAWKSLMHSRMAEFLKYAAKTVRKHNGQLVTISQELEDLLGNALVKKTIVNSSAIKVLLDQGDYKEAFDDVKELVGLSDHEAELVKSINKLNDPRFRKKEVFIKTGPLAKVYGVEVSGIEYSTFTTTKEEYDSIYRMQKRNGMDLERALIQDAENRELNEINKR
ncbi:TraG family conjugative transposon ATPase [Parapedobacter sp. 10938]|uniref:TraG family conjugative transposon ATPase n=1 Tax=Parapedobacter flavus TaxID=3110225 RepID=UPI002DB79A53|nr:TraG family conjugative transposon ATPase [Parapedobacter sp. 10938]MEC3881829.1 TraG family conjugative transposon ATPase [Parapedobacter sp. 10938]